MMRMPAPRHCLPLLIVVALAWAPRVALACAVCTAGREEENRFAFLIMTLFMSALPLVLIGGLALFLRNRFRSQEERERIVPPAEIGAGAPPLR